MLRRKKKGERRERRAPSQAVEATAPATRRRARADAPVPEALRLREPSEDPAPYAAGGGVVLVTGFEPFGGEAINPSWEICRQLPPLIAGHRVETCRVPCEFRRAIEVVAGAVRRHKPAIVLCLGQGGGRAHLGVERVAINVDDARIPDNAGARPVDEPVAASGPPAYFATLPVKAMAAAMRAAGVPAEVSNSAGTYVCNHLMYGVLHFLAASNVAARAGFIHVPYCEPQVLDKPGAPALALATMTRGIEAAVAAACAHAADIKEPLPPSVTP